MKTHDSHQMHSMTCASNSTSAGEEYPLTCPAST